jgi:hypothetical protein
MLLSITPNGGPNSEPGRSISRYINTGDGYGLVGFGENIYIRDNVSETVWNKEDKYANY